METADIETVIVGAGVIGLAIGAALARQGSQAFILEAGPHLGNGISSRNSEVIHSGIYYPEASLRRRLCVDGREQLYAYCESRSIAHRRCGKFVVATSAADVAKIEAIAQQAKRNGVDGVTFIDGKKACALEPALSAVAALDVPQTGIIDSHAYMASLAGEIESAGGAILLRHKVIAGRSRSGSFEIIVQTADASLRVTAKRLIIAAGPWTHSVAASLDGYAPAAAPPLTLAKGSYFSFPGTPVFKRLIYPAPVEGGLGTHLTLDLAGRMRFGPDVEWLDSNDPDAVDFNVDPDRSRSFYEAIRRYWPGLPDAALLPAYSGVRPKLSRRGEPAVDFLFDAPQTHGHPGLVVLYGIESPGLTSSLAIGRYVLDLLNEA